MTAETDEDDELSLVGSDYSDITQILRNYLVTRSVTEDTAIKGPR